MENELQKFKSSAEFSFIKSKQT